MRSLDVKRPIWTYIKQRKKQSLMIVFFGMVTQLLTIMIPVSIGKYYQLAFDMSGRRAQFMGFIPDAWWDSVAEFLFIFVLLIVGRYGFFFVYQYTLNQAGQQFIKTVKDDLFARQLQVHYSVYQERGVGKYLLRYSGDLNSLRNLYIKGGLSVVSDVFIVLVAFIWFFALSPAGAMIILFGSLLSYGVIHWITQRVEHYSMVKRDKTAGQLSFVSRTLHSMLSVILMNKQDVELKKYCKRSAGIVAAAGDYNRWFVANNGFIAFFQYAVLAVVLWMFHQSIQNASSNKLNAAHLTSFILLYITILPVIRRLFRLPTVYKLGRVSLKKLEDIYQLRVEQAEAGTAVENLAAPVSVAFQHLDWGEGHVELKAVAAHHYVLYHDDSNESYSSVLQNGQSKPSFEALLAAFIGLSDNSAYEGQIAINGKTIAHCSAKSLRAQVSVLSAQVPLLGRTVYEAITVSRSKYCKKRSQVCLDNVQQALNLPEAARLSLTDKIGENGSSLSKMQYQVLCLVRGLNTTKPILLCDDFDLLSKSFYLQLLTKQTEEKKKTVIRYA